MQLASEALASISGRQLIQEHAMLSSVSLILLSDAVQVNTPVPEKECGTHRGQTSHGGTG